MAKRKVRQKQHPLESATSEKPTQKRALAEAIRHLGPAACHSALAQFVQEQFGMELAFYMVMPRVRSASKQTVPSADGVRGA
jgi:hypothetical protein